MTQIDTYDEESAVYVEFSEGVSLTKDEIKRLFKIMLIHISASHYEIQQMLNEVLREKK